jgi:hypothetical protein
MESHVSTRAKRIILGIFLVLGTFRGVFAHDIGASNATFLVRATGIDVELYMGLGAGALMIAGDGQLVVITPATFADFSDRLQAAGSSLFTLTAADGTPMAPDAVNVSLSEQNDIVYDLHYPLPAALPGVLKIHADYIDRMAEGHLGSIYVLNAVGDRLGFGEVRTGAEDVAAHLPAADSLGRAAVSPPPPPPPPPAAPAATPGQSSPGAPWFLWAVLGGGLLLIAAAALRGISRKNL